MRVVLATHHLSGLAGSETYLLTVAEQLERLGHQVVLWAIEQGRSAEIARERGLVVALPDGTGLPPQCDALITQDAPSSYALAERYPAVPQLFVCHSILFDLSVPPQIPGVVALLVVLSDATEAWARGLAHAPEIVRLRQPVDLARFTPIGEPREQALVVLALGNLLEGPRLRMLETACDVLSIELRQVGVLTEVSERPETLMADADIVVGKGRVIVEALACGRAAFILDQFGWDGWVTPDRYAAQERDGFGGRAYPAVADVAFLVEQLRGYDAGLGIAGRDLALRHHSSIEHATQLGALLARLEPAAVSVSTIAELGRLTRLVWRAEGRVAEARWDAQHQRENALALERDLAALRRSLEQAQPDGS